MIPSAIKELAKRLAELPGIGPRQGLRLAFHLARLPKSEISNYSTALGSLTKLKECEQCFLMHDNVGPLCSICADPKRDQTIVAVVEKDTDVLTLEKAKSFTGRYLIVGDIKKAGSLDMQHKARITVLKKTTEKTGVLNEIIIALSPTTIGDLNASLLAGELKGLSQKITRLARGIPTGGEIEFADEQTLIDSLKNRS